MVIVSFNGFEVIQLFSEGGGVGGDFPPGGLNRVKARLSAKPLNSRVTHVDNERVCTWRPFEVTVFELGRSCFLRKLGTNLPRRKNRESPGNEIGWVRGSGHFPKWRLLYPTRSSLECRYIPLKK